MIGYDVWRVLPTGARVLCGTLACTVPESHGRFRAEFAYAPDYPAAGHGALEPIHLPLRTAASWQSEQFYSPLAVFEDALPDAWGRELMRRLLPRATTGAPYLLGLLGDDGIGALRFTRRPESEAPPPLPLPAAPATLAELVSTARALEARRPVARADLARGLAAGRTPGGARPKALIDDAGLRWIAKFPSAVLDEGLDIVGLEAATLTAATAAGLSVPPHRLRPVGRRRVLLVQRFDVLGAAHAGRAHMVSLKSLCGVRAGVEAASYDELAAALRRASARPREDVAALFRLALFNAAVGNTDDHAKNFWMLDAGAGWRLAPAFDLLPDTGRRGEHALAIGLHPRVPDAAGWRALARAWGVAEVEAIVDSVLAAVRDWPAQARAAGVPAEQIAEFRRDQARRMKAILA